MPDKAKIVLPAYNGPRQPLAKNVRWSVQARDGRSSTDGQKTLHFPNLTGGSQILDVDWFDNFADLYTLTATADGYDAAAWHPVHVSKAKPVEVNLMFLPKDGQPHFA